MNLFTVFEGGDYVLIATFLLLVVLSISNWFIIIKKYFIFYKRERVDARFHEIAANGAEFLKSKEYQKLAQNSNSLANLIDNSKKFLEKKYSDNHEMIAKKFALLCSDDKRNLDKGNLLLGTSASLSPFIGLFGTVWGIYNALIEIGDKKTAGLDVIATPVGEALIATALGLFVAIPAAGFFNYFNKKSQILCQNNLNFIEHLLIDRKIK
jgi:biopolymer transport protein ExbB